MNGFRAELFDKIVGLNGHAVVQGFDGRLSDWQEIAEKARKTPGVTSALPLIEQPLMASANGRVEGVLVRGMRPRTCSPTPPSRQRAGGRSQVVAPGSGLVAIGSRLADNSAPIPVPNQPD